jgi:hypothetical protein
MISLHIFSAHICLQFLYSSIPLIVLYLFLALVSGVLEKSRIGADFNGDSNTGSVAATASATIGRGRFFKAVVVLVFILAGVLTVYQKPPAALARLVLACTRQVQCAPA